MTKWNRGRRIAAPILAGLALASAMLIARTAEADCSTKVLTADLGGDNFANPEQEVSAKGKLRATLTVKFATNEIAGCRVNLRNYNGKLVGPTLRAKPGDRITLDIYNLLPADKNNPQPSSATWADHNGPADFNVTNFHAHGLSISPGGESDNVLRRMEPRPESEGPYTVVLDIPDTHPTGTFWYHAHIHGSTAVQVASGMAGALIIEGDAKSGQPKSLDSVPAIAAANEKIFVMQQIQYGTDGEMDHVGFGPGTWRRTLRRTLINGVFYPTIYMRPGEVQRWRFIHAGIREAVLLQLDGHKLHEIALDGLSTGKVVPWGCENRFTSSSAGPVSPCPTNSVPMFPGYRVDTMVKASDTEGEYVLYDVAAPSQVTFGTDDEPEDYRPLAKIVVTGDPLETAMALPTSDGDSTTGVAETKAHTDLAWSTTPTGATNTVKFVIGNYTCTASDKTCTPCTGGAGCKLRFMVDNGTLKRPFAGEPTKYTDAVGKTAKWNVQSTVGSHPFHIHVNPFQMKRLIPNPADSFKINKEDTVWKDTVWVTNTEQTLLTEYKGFGGKFVMHCHILDHEDEGMMTLVELTQPAPGSCAYSGAKTLKRGKRVAAIRPTGCTNYPTEFTVTPALPTGLKFDPYTGAITGKPTTAQSAATYTVTPKNASATGTTFTVQITVEE